MVGRFLGWGSHNRHSSLLPKKRDLKGAERWEFGRGWRNLSSSEVNLDLRLRGLRIPRDSTGKRTLGR